jgi:cell division protein FtsB
MPLNNKMIRISETAMVEFRDKVINEMNTLKQEKDKLKGEKDKLRQELKEAYGENNKLRQELKEADGENNKLKRENDKLNQELKKENDKLKQYIYKLARLPIPSDIDFLCKVLTIPLHDAYGCHNPIKCIGTNKYSPINSVSQISININEMYSPGNYLLVRQNINASNSFFMVHKFTPDQESKYNIIELYD